MRTAILLIITTIFVFFSKNSFSQSDIYKYKFSKIYLKTGETLKANDVTVSKDSISYSYINRFGGNVIKTFGIDEISDIKVASKNYIYEGLGAGALVGIFSLLIIEPKVEDYKQGGPPTEIPWWSNGFSSSNNSYSHEMAFAPKVYIVGGFTIIGGLVGMSIRKGWESVFPNQNTVLNNFNLNMNLNPMYSNSANFTITYRF